jgi:FecR-like protein
MPMADYLWDKSGEPDADVEQLERLLGRFATIPPPPSIRTRPIAWRSVRTLAPLLATAAAVIVIVGAAWRASRVMPATPEPLAAWTVAAMDGQPRIGAVPLGASGRLTVGETLVTDPESRARMDVSTIGEVTVEPDTTVTLVATRTAHHRLALERGTLSAFIWAPPGQFVVDTPSATAVDLGCAYTLRVDDGGAGLLSVRAGWVAFELNGRESFVPAGASCPTRPGAGPGTPRYDDAEAALTAALDTIDFGAEADRPAALATVLDRARPRDALTLWHLLSRVAVAERGAVFDALASRLPAPQGVTREAVMRLDRGALDRWWNALDLGDASFWRRWKGNPF